jgi:hypothetical protein
MVAHRIGEPPGLDRAHWWPPAHGYGPEGARIRIAAPEQFPEITAGLLDLGYPEAAVRQILGENMLRLARQVWRWTATGACGYDAMTDLPAGAGHGPVHGGEQASSRAYSGDAGDSGHTLAFHGDSPCHELQADRRSW